MDNATAVSSEEKTHCLYFKRSVSEEECIKHFTTEKTIRDLSCIGGNCQSPFKPHGVCETCIGQSVQRPPSGTESGYYFTEKGEKQCPFHIEKGEEANPETEILMGKLSVEAIKDKPEEKEKEPLMEGEEMKKLSKTEAKVYEALKKYAKAGECGNEEREKARASLGMEKPALAFQMNSLKKLKILKHVQRGVVEIKDAEYSIKESAQKKAVAKPKKEKAPEKKAAKPSSPEPQKESAISEVISGEAPSHLISNILNVAFSGNGSSATLDVYETMARELVAGKCKSIAEELQKVATAFEKVGKEIIG